MPNDSTTESVPSAVTTGSPIPLGYGYVWGTGKRLNYFQLQNTGDQKLDLTHVGMWALGADEWDGNQELWINDELAFTSENDDLSQFLFHRGCDAILGSGLNPTSTGPDQGVDSFFK